MPTANVLRVLSPREWTQTFPVRPILESDAAILKGGLLQRWTGTPAVNPQPRLDHHNLTLHLGGPKRVCRDGEGPRRNVDVELGALTFVPSGAAFTWATQGPSDFAYFFLDQKQLRQAIMAEFDRDPDAIRLQDSVGKSDPLLWRLYESILEEIRCPGPVSKISIETNYDALLVRLLCTHSNLSDSTVSRGYALAPYRLRRVKDYVQSNLEADLELSELAEVAGLSRFHFCRAFHRATGMAPHAFVVNVRIEEAKRLLRSGELSIGTIAKRCGFSTGAQFATSFKKSTGETPSSYRHRT